MGWSGKNHMEHDHGSNRKAQKNGSQNREDGRIGLTTFQRRLQVAPLNWRRKRGRRIDMVKRAIGPLSWLLLRVRNEFAVLKSFVVGECLACRGPSRRGRCRPGN